AAPRRAPSRRGADRARRHDGSRSHPGRRLPGPSRQARRPGGAGRGGGAARVRGPRAGDRRAVEKGGVRGADAVAAITFPACSGIGSRDGVRGTHGSTGSGGGGGDMKRWRIPIGALALVAALAAARPVRAGYLEDAGWGSLTVLSNVVYMPAKLCYATLGGLTGGCAFALAAAIEALADAALDPRALDAGRVGVALGTTLGGMQLFERWMAGGEVLPAGIGAIPYYGPAVRLARALGCRGPVATAQLAC